MVEPGRSPLRAGDRVSTSGTIKGCEARTLLFIVHDAEGNGPRKPQIWRVYDSGDKLVLKGR